MRLAAVMLILSGLGLVSSTVYLVLAVLASRRFRNSSEPLPAVALPPVTLLKPVHGAEPFLEHNLESFFRQDYPDFEIIFGAREAGDPALKIVEKLRAKYPHIKCRVVLSGEPEYPNAKVFALEKMIWGAATPVSVRIVCAKSSRHCSIRATGSLPVFTAASLQAGSGPGLKRWGCRWS